MIVRIVRKAQAYCLEKCTLFHVPSDCNAREHHFPPRSDDDVNWRDQTEVKKEHTAMPYVSRVYHVKWPPKEDHAGHVGKDYLAACV